MPLVVGSEQDYPPFAVGQTDETAGGFTVDLWKAVAAQGGLRYAIHVRPFRQILDEFKAGEVDVMINLAQSEERRAFADFSVPHVVVHGAIFVREGGSRIRSEADLGGKSILVLHSDLAHDYAVAKGWEPQLVLVDTAAEGLKLLASGQHDAMLLSRLAGLQTLRRLKIRGIEALDAKAGFSQQFSFAVRKGNVQLLARINDALAATKASGTYDALYQQWFGSFETPDISLRQLLKYAGPLAAVSAALIVFLLVRQQERERTQELLRRGEERLRLALTAARQGLFDLNVQTGEYIVSPEYAAMLGHDPAEFRETLSAWRERLHPQDREQAEVAYLDCLAGRRQEYRTEFRQRTKDGQWKWILSLGSLVARSADGRPLRVLGTHTDISERKQAEDVIRASNVMLEGVTHLQRDFLVEGDPRRSFDRMLTLLLETTASEYGFIGEVLRQSNGLPYLKTHAITDVSWNEETRAFYERNSPAGLEFHNLKTLFGAVIATGETVIAEDPLHDPRRGGLPPGHPPLRAFLGTPFFHGDEMIGMVGLANRAGGYDQALVDGLAPLLATCSGMVHSFRLERQRKRTDEELQFLATHDELTGLPNRALFFDRLERLIARGGRERARFALLFADLDNFKVINDSLGHAVGDELLKTVAQRLVQTLRAKDTVARFGGDEFVLILVDIKPPALQRAIDRIAAVVAQPVHIGDHVIHTSASIGISLFPEDAEDAGRLLQNADSAMYLAKDRGKRTAHFFSAPLHEAARERLELESDLRAAMEVGGLHLAYQPQVDLRTGALAGVEALVRWNDPRRGSVPASDIVVLAEKAGLMDELGRFVFDSALAQMAAWRSEGKKVPRLSVNLSAVQLRDRGFVSILNALLRRHGVAPSELTVEITESALILDPQVAEERLRELKDAGVLISLDDFGTGYSSLSFLRRFPIDELKIDRSFIARIDTDPEDRIIAQTVLAMARSLKRGVVAEGIESRPQLETLRGLDCPLGQGFYFSRPCAPEEIGAVYSSGLARGGAEAQAGQG